MEFAGMPRFALGLVVLGLASILLTVILVMGDATLPGGLPLFAAALLAGAGGISLVCGLWLLEPRRRDLSPGLAQQRGQPG
ncbi:hypothetical protein [Roseomonas sp. AR75]|jgi:hypothetical protein|uniref:hypothetical protein n=1 Tax=Roseomonas sp. AR75 TaxID=2562311 RepID=UPI0010BFAF78|nr:hypothetical protein [Roseomonas sp. AR75]